MGYEHLVFSAHAVRRMFERGIGPSEVEGVLQKGEVIAAYPEDRPFPSWLILGFLHGRPLHVVAALDQAVRRCHVVTVYEPDPALWDKDFKARKIS